jgi:hypothetical protein
LARQTLSARQHYPGNRSGRINTKQFCLAGGFDTLPDSPAISRIMDKHFQILEHPRETAIDVTRAVLKAFRTHGIRIPFPQREVHLLSAP